MAGARTTLLEHGLADDDLIEAAQVEMAAWTK